ncbi:hypothetical protein SAMN05428949_0824 [Chitinophaga sp. YR627]|nr:hypothetical protein SAMN05428949_0824 [Chitinophaga sp. YR627]
MKHLHFLSWPTRILMITTAVFLIYGYSCRFLGVYFFWESKSIGWVLFFVTLILFLLDRIKLEKTRNGKTIGEKIGIAVQSLVLVTKAVLFFVIPHTEFYENAKSYIMTNPGIEQQTGPVNDIFLLPYGAISSRSNSAGTTGQADLHFVVKGRDKYIDLNLLMGKETGSDWQIVVREQ